MIRRIAVFFLGRARFNQALADIFHESFKRSRLAGESMTFFDNITISATKHTPQTLAIEEALEEVRMGIQEELKEIKFEKLYLSDIRITARTNNDETDVYEGIVEVDASAEVKHD